jgi:CheY-like chemotaxis protein
MSMPRMDGVEATKRLRASGSTSFIIGVTANAMEEHRELCLKNGMNVSSLNFILFFGGQISKYLLSLTKCVFLYKK